jgi:hypothetical protein
MLNPLQEFLQQSPEQNPLVVTTSNTLKEIAELKNEIIKLTSSLRNIKGSNDEKEDIV